MKENLKSKLALALATTMMWSPIAAADVVNAMIHVKSKIPSKELAKNVTNPSSARFGQFYTPEEIKSLSAPDDEQYQELLSQLQNEGLQIVSESKTHLWLSVKADSSVFERVFQTQFEFSENRERRALLQANVPVYMSLIDSVGGLNSNRKSRPKFQKQSVQNQDSANPAATANSGISPSTIKSVYGFNSIYQSGISGQGQDIAVATYNDFNLSDVQYYYKAQNISPAPVVDKVTFNGTPPQDENSAMETQLDTEFSGMIAPGANIHVFTSATNDDTGELQLFTSILDDNRAKVVNYSWGGCETQLDPQHATDMENIFAQAVAQGINILVASGDSGSDSCQDGTVAADWPGASPYVLAVGGTTLTVSGGSQGNNQGSETAWNGSGGGISVLFALPSYQSGIGPDYKKRSYPDVAFNADPASGEMVYAHQNGVATWIQIGGTSMASPQWAGFLTLVGASRASLGKAGLGFVNPLLYAVNASGQSQYAASFNDIVSGSNGAYSAGRGWDAVTGLGSMQAQALLNVLSQ